MTVVMYAAGFPQNFPISPVPTTLTYTFTPMKESDMRRVLKEELQRLGLQKRMQKMKQRIKDLEDRLEKLEHGTGTRRR